MADALTLLPYLPPDAHRLADVGSGGGVPGLPLAIARPDVAVTLIEATKKKAAFLREAARNSGWRTWRCSKCGPRTSGRRPSTASRSTSPSPAVATMDWLAEWCLPLVKKRGTMLAMKGQKVAEELPIAAKAIKILGGDPAVVHPVELPGTEHRVIVEIHKSKKGDLRYLPRAATREGAAG